jgi:hypothetical protein
MTHVEHLSGIISEGALVCDAEAARRSLSSKSIAYSGIKARRAVTPVQNLQGEAIAAGGMLSDYVPFYFCNRSPMLGAIYMGKIDNPIAQREVIYLVSSTERIAPTDLTWCFTDGHGIEGFTDFFDDLADLNQLDWKAIDTWRWGGKWLQQDPHVKRKKQAEFLVHERFPWTLVERIGVMDAEMASVVKEIIRGAAHQPPVAIEPKWYYN